jgi:UDP-N-acetylmuramoyl-tripeptide--D-alanyl-D-alanine ligase
MFFALRGEHFNANQFAAQALEKGARYAVIDEAEYKQDGRYILVDEVLQTMQLLARHHRRMFDIPVLGINGTNGKTTTKELLHMVLNQKFNTLATEGNLNNHIGLPITLLSLRPEHEFAIIEMGANHVGEIARLCEIAEPTHGLTTNIGKAHMEGFGGLEGAIRGESELYDYMLKHGGDIFVNSQDPILGKMAARFPEAYTYPASGDYYEAELISADPFIVYKNNRGKEIETQIIGTYNFENIAAALCVGKYFGVRTGRANRAVAAYQPANKRSQLIKRGSNTIIMDAYNANPDSMKVAVESLARIRSAYRVAILGDMFELGDDSDAEHEALGQLLASQPFDEVLLCGSMMNKAKEACPNAHHFTQKEELAAYLDTQKYKKATILLKASRGIALETLLDHIK